MARPTLYIALMRSRIEAVLVRGRGEAREASVRLDPEKFRAAWEHDLGPLDGPLGDLLADLGLPTGARVMLGYESPQMFADVIRCDADETMDAERVGLKIADRVPFVVSANPLAFAAAPKHADGSRSMLVAADSDTAVEAISGWLARAGLSLEEAAPLPAWALTGLLRDPPSLPDPVAIVDMGSSTTTIAGFRSGGLVFSRSVNAGYDMVVEALASLAARAETEANAGADPETGPETERAELSDEQRVERRRIAHTLLFERGIPGRNERVEIGPGLDGQRVLGALQPVLQRFAVEIRQTIRFGFGETDLLRTRLAIVGPGGGIGSIEEVLVTHLELEALGPEVRRGGTGSARRARQMADVGRTGVGLAAASVIERRASGGLSRALLAGGVAAVALLVGEAAYNWTRASEAKDTYREVRREVDRLREEDNRWSGAAALAERLTAAEASLDKNVGPLVSWEATLAELSRLASGTVSLSEIVAKADDRRPPRVELGGFATASAGAEAGAVLTRFIDRLRESRVVDSVEIGGTTLEDREGEPALRFTLTLSLAVQPRVASAGGEDR